MTDRHTRSPSGSGLALYFCDVCRRAHMRISFGGPVVFQVDELDSAVLRGLAEQANVLAERQDAAMGEEAVAGHG